MTREDQQSKGHFWAIGVGPGDPELLTLKAVKLLQRADVIYHAGPAPDQGRSWEIVRGLLRPEQIIRTVLAASMREVSGADGKDHYRPAVDQMAADCRSGLEVAYITEGDPTLYSTAAPIWQLLAEHHPDVKIEIVPGVSSVTAAAARVGWPLAQKDDTLRVVPAGYHAHQLPALLAEDSLVCLLKVQSVFPQLLATLEELGPGYEAAYVENLGTDREWITHDLADAVGRDRYFSLVLVRRRQDDFDSPGTEGKVWIVGLGPGDPDLLSQHAGRVLRSAQEIVGYEGYLQRLAPLGLRGRCHASPIGAESERAALALRLAQTGRRVALVSSGDGGVYGMASLLLETAAQAPDVRIEVIPGITAAVSAAALLGAPLGHDFACVSLSDLLTPWPVIEQRLHAAGHGDYVLAVYNPISQRRTWQLPRTREILLGYRQPETPVGIVKAAYRPGGRAWHTTLGELTTAGLDMETTLIIGSSQTRLINGRMVTPRGYGERS